MTLTQELNCQNKFIWIIFGLTVWIKGGSLYTSTHNLKENYNAAILDAMS